MTDLVVIGGGPAGMICAAMAAKRGLSVTMLDRNLQLGRKLRITGKGRCNVTNACDTKEFMANIPGDGRFLYSAMSRFGTREVMAFFEELGVPLKVERGNRVFPVSDNANDIADALARYCRSLGVKTLRTSAKEILQKDGAVCAVMTGEGRIDCGAAAICTGGRSYPKTGSDGSGYRLAEAHGHTVTPTRPSLVPLESGDPWCAEMQGFSLKNVTLSAYENDKLIFRELGEMLFTHFGVSGPLVLSASAKMRHMGSARYRLEIDLKPALDEKKLDARLLRDFEKFSNREFRNALGELAGRTMIPVLVELSGIPGDTKVHDITREQRLALRHLLKAFPVSVSGTRPIDEAIVTAGGVSTREVDPRTMESKLLRGLYFAGEVLDLDAYTGGFNLQIAWCTGFVAGNSVRRRKEMKNFAVAIDGPSGAGKSSLARRCAAELGFLYVDTGAIYRTVGLAAWRRGLDRRDEAAVAAILPELDIQMRYNDKGEQRMILNGEDVSEAIRMPEISICASDVSALGAVRSYLLEMQRKLARENKVIMDGRDIGTVVLPDAPLKIYLTASAEARAQRRMKEQQAKGIQADFEEVLQGILYRDQQDMNRAEAPLRQAEDAVLVDTTDIDFDASFQLLCRIIRERMEAAE